MSSIDISKHLPSILPKSSDEKSVLLLNKKGGLKGYAPKLGEVKLKKLDDSPQIKGQVRKTRMVNNRLEDVLDENGKVVMEPNVKRSQRAEAINDTIAVIVQPVRTGFEKEVGEAIEALLKKCNLTHEDIGPFASDLREKKLEIIGEAANAMLGPLSGGEKLTQWKPVTVADIKANSAGANQLANKMFQEQMVPLISKVRDKLDSLLAEGAKKPLTPSPSPQSPSPGGGKQLLTTKSGFIDRSRIKKQGGALPGQGYANNSGDATGVYKGQSPGSPESPQDFINGSNTPTPNTNFANNSGVATGSYRHAENVEHPSTGDINSDTLPRLPEEVTAEEINLQSVLLDAARNDGGNIENNNSDAFSGKGYLPTVPEEPASPPESNADKPRRGNLSRAQSGGTRPQLMKSAKGKILTKPNTPTSPEDKEKKGEEQPEKKGRK